MYSFVYLRKDNSLRIVQCVKSYSVDAEGNYTLLCLHYPEPGKDLDFEDTCLTRVDYKEHAFLCAIHTSYFADPYYTFIDTKDTANKILNDWASYSYRYEFRKNRCVFKDKLSMTLFDFIKLSNNGGLQH